MADANKDNPGYYFESKRIMYNRAFAALEKEGIDIGQSALWELLTATRVCPDGTEYLKAFPSKWMMRKGKEVLNAIFFERDASDFERWAVRAAKKWMEDRDLSRTVNKKDVVFPEGWEE